MGASGSSVHAGEGALVVGALIVGADDVTDDGTDDGCTRWHVPQVTLQTSRAGTPPFTPSELHANFLWFALPFKKPQVLS